MIVLSISDIVSVCTLIVAIFNLILCYLSYKES